MIIPFEYFLQRDNQNIEKNFDIIYSDEESLHSKLFLKIIHLKKLLKKKIKNKIIVNYQQKKILQINLLMPK